MPVLSRYQRVGEWTVIKRLGEGQFAEVYEVKDSKDGRYAMKIEKRKDQKTVKQEHKVVKKIYQDCKPFVCQVVDSGSWEDRSYMVMELLGANLAEGRKHQAVAGRCDLPQVRHVAIATLDAIEKVHVAGYLHRDVKPANFALATPGADPWTSRWVLIDFGLARRYTDEHGQVAPERPEAAFRGSTSYASINAHLTRDLGRRDDLWSWLYVLVELIEGTLPWRSDKEAEYREQVLQRKQWCIDNPMDLTRQVVLPEPLRLISEHLRSLAFIDAPNYSWIRQMLEQLPASLDQQPYSFPPQHHHQQQQRSPTALVYQPSLQLPGSYAPHPSPSAPPQLMYSHSYTPPPQPSPNGGGQYAAAGQYAHGGYAAHAGLAQQPSPGGGMGLGGGGGYMDHMAGYSRMSGYASMPPDAHMPYLQNYHQMGPLELGQYGQYASTAHPGTEAMMPYRAPLAETPASPIDEGGLPEHPFGRPPQHLADNPASPPLEEDMPAASYEHRIPHADARDSIEASSPLHTLANSPSLTPTFGSSRAPSAQLLGKHSREVDQQLAAAPSTRPDAGQSHSTHSTKRVRSCEAEAPLDAPRQPQNGPGAAAGVASHQPNGTSGHQAGANATPGEDGVARVGHFIEYLQQGGASQEAVDAMGALRRLAPSEGLGCVAWLFQNVASCTQADSQRLVAAVLFDMATFAQDLATRIVAQHKQQQQQQHKQQYQQQQQQQQQYQQQQRSSVASQQNGGHCQ